MSSDRRSLPISERAPTVNDELRNVFLVENYSSGDSFEGDFKDGQRHGVGTYYFKNKDRYMYYQYNWKVSVRYDGEFSSDCISGRGTYFYVPKTDGLLPYDIYEGEWAKGKRNGNGTYTYNDGKTTYEGNWANDLKEGEVRLRLIAAIKR
jgi:hypothetical protein